MGLFFLKRFVTLLATLIGASIVVFLVLEILPGNAAQILMGPDASPDAVAALATKLGLDQPASLRYWQWVSGLVVGNMGDSYAYSSPVLDLVLERLALTVPLALMAMVITTVLALAAGVYAAARHNKLGDVGVMGLAQIGIAIPNFWFAILLILLFSVKLQWFSAGGFPGWTEDAGGSFRHLIPMSAAVSTLSSSTPSAPGWLHRALRHRSFVIGAVLSALLILAALLSFVWTPWSPYEMDLANKLAISNLRIRLQTHRGPADAVRGVSFSLARGETLGLIGESGCGKSITAMSLMGLLPESAQVTGSIRFDGQELVGRTDAQMCKMRGNRIGMVFQEPMTALNPVHTIGRQVAEPLRLHRGMNAAAARTEAIALLDRRPRLSTIPGTVPELVDLPVGCPFAGRCSYTVDDCHHKQPEATLVATDADGEHLVRCLRREAIAEAQSASVVNTIEVTNLVREYTLPREHLFRPPGKTTRAEQREQAAQVLSQLFRNAQHPYTQSLVGAVPQVLPGRARARRAAAAAATAKTA
eukprot:gene5191-5243_t